MTKSSTHPISKKTLQRMPKYIHFLRRLRNEGNETISASVMAEKLNIHHTQVRRDLALTGVVGVPKVGHNIAKLLEALEKYINWNDNTEAFLVGAGNLGIALMNYHGFEESGIKIVAGFDKYPSKCKKPSPEMEILDISKFKDLAQRMHIQIGIITTPANAAQEVANLMVESGIKAIWNFAPIQLEVSDEIIVENAELYASLAVLSKKLKEKSKPDTH